VVSMEAGLVGKVEDMEWCPRFAGRWTIIIIFVRPKNVHM